MRLVRWGEKGRERPGVLDERGRVRDLSGIVVDIDGSILGNSTLERLAGLDAGELPEAPAEVRLGPCVASPSKIVCIGLNYADHAEELGLPVPSEPTMFLKPPTALAGPFDPVRIPPGSSKLDYEAELAVVIGTEACRVEREAALAHVAGYCIANDITERDWSLNQSGQWTRGKGGDGFGPLGPWLVTGDEIADPQDLAIWLEIDGRRLQDGSTRTMIFPVTQIVSFVSHYMTLLPGDVILTGTPPGVGAGRSPQVFLRPGNILRVGIAGLGEMRLPVVATEEG
jgi:ureidoglycolate lyase/2,4-diketo-3-deoxy-L-fuconate hydrolase